MVSVLRPKKIITLIVDLMLMIPSLWLAFTLRNFQTPNLILWTRALESFVVVFLFYIFVFYLHGLYTLQDIRSFSKRMQKTIQAFIFGTVVAFLFFYIFPDAFFTPKTILVLFSSIYLVFFSVWRQIAPKFVGALYPTIKVAFLGWDEILNEVVADQSITSTFNLEYSLVVPEEPQKHVNVDIPSTTIDELYQVIKTEQVQLLVLSEDFRRNEKVLDLLFRSLSPTVVYISLPEFFEMVTARIPINAINQMWFLEHLNLRDKAAYEKLKRVTDVFGSIFGLVISLPLWPFVMLSIKLSSKGPVFFNQVRSGKSGKPFHILKFRTMRIEGNDQRITTEKDSRITMVGNFLRKSRLDELPQLINILKGEMSFVGPRPERPEIIEELEKQIPFYRQRMLVSPGLTGWDQVSGEYHSATVEDTYKKLQYDLYYVKNRSVYIDTIILFKTIATVLGRVGR